MHAFSPATVVAEKRTKACGAHRLPTLRAFQRNEESGGVNERSF